LALRDMPLALVFVSAGNQPSSGHPPSAIVGLDEIQLEGKRRMNATGFLHGY
jgi:hypothetical protein